MKKRIAALATIMLISLAGAACVGGADSEAAGPSSTSAVAVNTSTGNPSLDFTVPVARNSDGVPVPSTFSLADHRGKPAVLYFSFVG